MSLWRWKVSIYSQFVESFWNHQWILDFVKCFVGVHFENHVIVFLCSNKMVYYINWFLKIKLNLHSWDKSHLAMVCNSFYVMLASVCNILWRIFCICIHEVYYSVVLVAWVCDVLFWLALVLGWNWPHRIGMKFLPFSILWKSLWDIDII